MESLELTLNEELRNVVDSIDSPEDKAHARARIRDIAAYTAMALSNPAMVEQSRENIGFCVSQIASLASIETSTLQIQVSKSLMSVVVKVVTVLISSA